MISLLIGTGIFGLSGVTWLCPLLALPLYYFQRKTHRFLATTPSNGSTSFQTIDILIPAHNESGSIGSTLHSIQRSIDSFRASSSPQARMNINIHVGADSCTDNTVQIAAQFPTVSVTEFPDARSKWMTLNALVAASLADWVILVDSGTLWPENYLGSLVGAISSSPDAMAIAPTYRPLKSGWLTRILWTIETLLKRMESACGGPVSLHGATIAYHTDHLKKVLAHLGDTLWLNDDVVIPLTLRTLFPEATIAYPVGHVGDKALRHNQLDLGRRKRMVLGNLQWVTTLWPESLRRNPVAGLVAIRRIFRILWAYWLACIMAVLALAFPPLRFPMITGVVLLVALSGSFRQFAGAGWSSLLAPFRMTRPDWQLQGNWE